LPLLLSPGLGIRNELSGRDNILLALYFMGMTYRQASGMME
jgi:ABC-type polysaccharide/polyol phosphate transport system ATPase subunit